MTKTNDLTDAGLSAMLADYMENGFLENIVDMFLHDSSLYGLICRLIQDDRVRVRIGVTAMLEELRTRDRNNMPRALPGLLPLLKHREPSVRGDAANLLGIIGDDAAVPFLEKILGDEDHDVRLIAGEAIEEIRQQLP